MKFNRKLFIDNTAGNVDAAFDCIDEIIDILNVYMLEDEAAEMHGAGCFGKHAAAQALGMLENKVINEYIDR